MSGQSIHEIICDYLDEDIPTSPGGSALVPCDCKAYGAGLRASCVKCAGSGWKMTMLRKLPDALKRWTS